MKTTLSRLLEWVPLLIGVVGIFLLGLIPVWWLAVAAIVGWVYAFPRLADRYWHWRGNQD